MPTTTTTTPDLGLVLTSKLRQLPDRDFDAPIGVLFGTPRYMEYAGLLTKRQFLTSKLLIDIVRHPQAAKAFWHGHETTRELWTLAHAVRTQHEDAQAVSDDAVRALYTDN